jgi:hypothetical protein
MISTEVAAMGPSVNAEPSASSCTRQLHPNLCPGHDFAQTCT